MAHALTTEFDKSRIAHRLRSLVERSGVLPDAGAFYTNQRRIFDSVAAGQEILEWRTRGQNAVMLMSYEKMCKLLDVLNLPVVETHMQYPGDLFQQARRGEIALALMSHKERRVLMVQKDAVLKAIELREGEEQTMQNIVARLETLMHQRGIGAERIEQLLDTLEQQEPPPP